LLTIAIVNGKVSADGYLTAPCTTTNVGVKNFGPVSFDSSGSGYARYLTGDLIQKFNGTTGEPIWFYPEVASTWFYPVVLVGSDGTVYVLDAGGVIALNSLVSTVTSPPLLFFLLLTVSLLSYTRLVFKSGTLARL
jgi:outer membrane protein assembly factor BamB